MPDTGTRPSSDFQPRVTADWLLRSPWSLKSDLWMRNKCLLFKSLRVVGVDILRYYGKSWWITQEISPENSQMWWEIVSYHLRITSWQAIAICGSGQVSSLQSQLISSVFPLEPHVETTLGRRENQLHMHPFPFFFCIRLVSHDTATPMWIKWIAATGRGTDLGSHILRITQLLPVTSDWTKGRHPNLRTADRRLAWKND